MAIKPSTAYKTRLADYYVNHVKKMSYVVVSMLVAINIALTGLLFFFSHYGWLEIIMLVIVPVVCFEVFSLMIVLKFALEPLEILTRVITRLSNQPTDLQAPPINDPRYVKSGLKDMVQTIYDRLQDNSDDNESLEQTAGANRILQQIPCGLIGINQDNEIVFANSTAPVANDIDGKRVLQLAFPSDDSLKDWIHDAANRSLTEMKIWQAIASTHTDTDDRRVFDVIAQYNKSTSGGIETVILIIDKTTVYEEGQNTVDFISIAAHELRGPITVIRGYLDVLIDELGETLEGEHHELLTRLDASASRLNGYINNILNVAKYDQKHLKLHLQKDSPIHVFELLSNDLNLRAKTQNRRLTVSIPNSLPDIAVDHNSISEVFLNLVDNAIKYSHEDGEVVLSATADQNYVKFSVKDDGIGIPSGVAQNLFKKFYRSHRSRSSVAGTGLGLYISRAIVESHGGEIGFTSTEGKGSMFYFTVPTYASVAEKLSQEQDNASIIKTSSGWIRNHSRMGG